MKESLPSLPPCNSPFLTKLGQFRTDLDVWNSSWNYLIDVVGFEDELINAIVCFPKEPLKFRQCMVDFANLAKIDVRQNGLFDLSLNPSMVSGVQSAIWTMPVVLAELLCDREADGEWPMITLKPLRTDKLSSFEQIPIVLNKSSGEVLGARV